MDCAPDWYKPSLNETVCPFGRKILGDVTVPYVWYEGYPGLSFASVVVFVAYSLVPLVTTLLAVIHFLRAALLRSCSRGRLWQPGSELQRTDGWRLRNMQESVKFVGFCVLAFATKWLLALPLEQLHRVEGNQRWVFVSAQRPPKSCVTTCAMPNGQSLWAYGLLAYFFLELCFRLNLPHLWEKGTYSRPTSTLLAVHPIRTRTFLLHTVAIFVLFAPVPMSRVMLSDASPEQAIFGTIAGIFLAVFYHCTYLCLFTAIWPLPTSLALRHRRGLVWLAMCLEGLCCCVCCRCGSLGRGRREEPLLSHEMQLGARGAGTDPEALTGPEEAEPTAVSSREPVLLPDLDPLFVELDESLLSPAVDWPCCSGLHRFFEFLTVSSAAEVARMSGRVDAAERCASAALQETAEAERRAQEAIDQAARADNYWRFAEQRAREAGEEAERALRQRDAASRLQREERERAEQQMSSVCQMASQVSGCLMDLQEATSSGELQRLARAVQEIHMRRQALAESGAGEAQEIFLQLGEIIARKQAECESVKSQWEQCLDHLKSRLKKTEEVQTTANPKKLMSDAETVFRCMMEAIRAGLHLPKSATATVQQAEKVLMRWQSASSPSPKQQHFINKIIGKVMWAGEKERYGDFTFTELCFCIQTVRQSDNTSFIDEGLKLIEDKDPKDLQSALEHLSNLVFLLDYIDKEDIDKAKHLFRALNAVPNQHAFCKTVIEKLCEEGDDSKVGKYTRADAFLQPDDIAVAKNDPRKVLKEIAQRGQTSKILYTFRDIFVMLASEQLQQFGVLMAPHHTQAIALLIFREFLQQLGSPILGDKRALIARVSTGEGKSMLIAAMAAFIALKRDRGGEGKQVHVVGTDERLVARDFKVFDQMLFRTLGIKAICLCRDSEGLEDHTWHNVWDHDIVYCLPHHVALLYTKEVTHGESLDKFKDCALLIDEVDALVIDRSPNDTILCNQESLSMYAMEVGAALHTNGCVPEEMIPQRGDSDYEQKHRVYKVARQKWKKAVEVDKDPTGTGFLRSSDTANAGWVARNPKSGMPDKTIQSTQLEFLRFRHRLKSAHFDMVRQSSPMRWLEPLFVMSKPLVFGRYHCILGFSGTLGNEEEKGFFQAAYRSIFVEVPEFLRTCCGDSWHTVQWATTSLQRPHSEYVRPDDFPQEPFVVLPDEASQLRQVRRLAFRARRHVPVLVIAGSVEQAQAVVEDLREEAQRSGGVDDRDVVRDLSHTQWSRSRMDYKDNLFLSTQRVGQHSTDPWRITVTDESGGRGTDYQMHDAEADRLGGLLLIVMRIPFSCREWVQYQGRTARQDRRGQMCAVLCKKDYLAEADGFGRALPPEAYGNHREGWAAPDAEAAAAQIIAFGTQDSRRALGESRRELVAGWRAHELCELICRTPGGLPRGREDFLRWIKGYLTSDLGALGEEAGRKFLQGAAVPPCSLPAEYFCCYQANTKAMGHQGRGVVFALDVSASMNCTVDLPGEGRKTRLEICRGRALKLLTDHVDDGDVIGLLLFDHKLRWKLEPSPVSEGRERLAHKLGKLEVKGGGTAMRTAIAEGARRLTASSAERVWDASRSILIVLTDGADEHSEVSVEGLAEQLRSFPGALLLISVGLSSEALAKFEIDFEAWEEALGGKASDGGRARHFKADWTDVDAAFARAREVLDDEVVGLDLASP